MPNLSTRTTDHPGDDTLTLYTDLLGNLRVPGAADRGAELDAVTARAAIYATRVRGDGTRRVYRSAWRGYEAWCRSLGREPLSGDPDLLAMYAIKRADDGVAVSTLRVDLAAIRTAHLRRSELVDLELGDVVILPGRGLRVLVRRSKTDQHGQGQEIAIWANPAEPLLCPVAALDDWLAQRNQARDLDWSAA